MASDKQSKQTHVLLVTFAAQGHINPVLRLGTRLASKGLHVTLATTHNASILHGSTTTTGGVRIQYFSDGLPIDYNRKTDIDSYMNSLAHFGPIHLSDLISNHPEKFAYIVNTPFLPWVADVAAEHGIPCAMLWIQPCTLYAIYYRFYNNLNHFPTITSPSVGVELPGLPLLHKEELPSFLFDSNPFPSFVDILTTVVHNMDKLKWVLGNSFFELEKDVIESMNDLQPFWPVGPLVPAELFGKETDGGGSLDLFKYEDTCIEWLNKQQPSSVVYISFGSLLMLSEKETAVIASALKRTKHPFLWVIKPPEMEAKEGDGKKPFACLEEIKEQGLVVKWSPQTEVLAHSAVGCFLSHCGWNSLLETITAGVPVIAYPQWTDQPTNAKLVADVWQVGVRLTKEQDGGLSVEQVERCLEEVMSGERSEEIRRNAAELKRAARDAVSDGGSSDRNIQMFVDDIVSSSS